MLQQEPLIWPSVRAALAEARRRAGVRQARGVYPLTDERWVVVEPTTLGYKYIVDAVGDLGKRWRKL